MSDINITAKTIEEFKEISDSLGKLPESISSQIMVASKSLSGVKCVIKYTTKTSKQVILPDTVTAIQNSSSGVTAISEDYLFVLSDELQKCNPMYRFIKCDNSK